MARFLLAARAMRRSTDSFLRCLLTSLLLASPVLSGCGGEATSPSEPAATAREDGRAAQGDGPGSATGAGADTAGPFAPGCAEPATVVARTGGGLSFPATGSTVRAFLVYQGTDVGLSSLSSFDRVLPPSAGPFEAGVNAGYWAELVDGDGARLYTDGLEDPTRLEAPGPNADFQNVSVDRCTPKQLAVVVPNDARARALVLYASPYGTSGAATELARFAIAR